MRTEKEIQQEKDNFAEWWKSQSVTTDDTLSRAFREVAWRAWEARGISDFYSKVQQCQT